MIPEEIIPTNSPLINSHLSNKHFIIFNNINVLSTLHILIAKCHLWNIT